MEVPDGVTVLWQRVDSHGYHTGRRDAGAAGYEVATLDAQMSRALFDVLTRRGDDVQCVLVGPLLRYRHPALGIPGWHVVVERRVAVGPGEALEGLDLSILPDLACACSDEANAEDA